MCRLIALLLILATTTTVATAQDPWENVMGMFFSEYEFTEANTRMDVFFAMPFLGYIVVLASSVYYVGGYEVGIEFSDQELIVLDTGGNNDWTNFGEPLNHIVGYGTPLVTTNGAAVLGWLEMLYLGSEVVTISFGPSEPSSTGGPTIADGINPNILYQCRTPYLVPEVAWLTPPVAVEGRSLSRVKALFD